MTRTLVLTILFSALAVSARAAPMRLSASQYELQVLNSGQPAASYWHDGENWILGHMGERYTLRVINHSGRPVEAVVSVDGRDVIDGQPASADKRGYLVPAWGSVDIDGWRISHEQAAAFRFSRVMDSYASRVGGGREVGVIGVAVFEQRRPPPVAYIPPPRHYAQDEAQPDTSCCANDRYKGEAMPAEKSAGGGGMMADAAPVAPPPAASAAPMDRPGSLGGAAGYGRAMAQTKKSSAENRPGLGTEYGEAVDSSITETTFDRASSRPQVFLGCRYNDRDGLLAMGIPVERASDSAMRETANPFPVVDRRFAPPPAGWTR